MLAYGCGVLNINYIISFATQLIYVVLELIRVRQNFPVIYTDYLYLMILTISALTFYNYNSQKFSKNFFLKKKKIHALNVEQK